MRVHCRCKNRKCRHYNSTRFTLAHPPTWYIRTHHAKCPLCRRLLSVDKYRSSGREHAARACDCTGYSFRHRRGSKWCHHNVARMAEHATAVPDAAPFPAVPFVGSELDALPMDW